MQVCKLFKQIVKCQSFISTRAINHKSVAQATIDKGHASWDASLRPVYMDAQVCCIQSIMSSVSLAGLS